MGADVRGAVQKVTVIVCDDNDGGKVFGENVKVSEVGGKLLEVRATNAQGEAHFDLDPGEYLFELQQPIVSGDRRTIRIPATERDRRITFGI